VSTAAPDPRRWRALALLCASFFMVVLDVAIVNVALPSIGRDLEFSQGNLQWVVTAYSLAFGGFLLLMGRAADLLGRRRVFMVGLVLFTLASLLCGLAWSEGVLIAARGIQGLGAAIISPAALSIVMTTFPEGAERNKALGAWGAVGGSGAAVGVLMGGVLTKYLGWEWIFFVNVPVGAAALLLTRRLVSESRREGTGRHFDPIGALTVTAGLVVLVYAISEAPDVGWAAFRTIALLAVSAALILAFLVWESRVSDPLMPLRIFRIRLVSAANTVGFLLGAALFSNFFVLTLYMQQVLGYSALQAGGAFLATAGTAVAMAGPAQALVTRLGPKPVLIVGLGLLLLATFWYLRAPVEGHYPLDLLPAFVAYGIGIPFAFIPVTVAALAGVSEREAGLGSGLINTSQQIGGAIGVAIVSTVATSYADDLLAAGDEPAVALTEGFQRGFLVIALIVAASIAVSAVFIRREEIPGEAAAGAVAS
jgi:EmrB/QacA subfamily drug resistance transporter